MPRGLRHSKPIWFGPAWRDARRCGRSRVGWVGGSAIGLEDPAQVGDLRNLRGFVGVLESPCAPRCRVDLIKSASVELPNAVCAPTGTCYVVLWYSFEDVSDERSQMGVWPSETIVVPPHPSVTFTQSDRPCTHPESPPLPTAMVRAHSHRCLCGLFARERRRRRRGTNAERRTSNAATHEWRQITRARTSRPHEHAINAHRARYHRFPFPPGTRELRRRRRSLVARSRACGVA